jgi:tRNA nucleotidyltransferase (CCA-adding enzyme)
LDFTNSCIRFVKSLIVNFPIAHLLKRKTARQVWEPFGRTKANLARPGKIYAQRSGGRVRVHQHAGDYKGKIDFMQKDLHRLIRDPNLIPSENQILLSSIANQAASLGMPCYLVGGFVRDLLLGKSVNDLDIVVEGDAIELGAALVKKHGGKLTSHTKFRTAAWHLTPDTSTLDTLDLITARKETYKHAGALPTIKPSTIDDDLRRRDFTINAMAIRLDGDHFGEVLDPLNGQDDLEKGTIRVLYPRSFIDDPTRIFRAIRYEQKYAFSLQLETRTLIDPEAFSILKNLSGERIRHEIDLIFEEEYSAQMLSRLHELGVFDVFDPSLPKFNKQYSGFLNSEPSTEFGFSVNKILLNYLLWFMDSLAEMIKFHSKRLDFNSDLTEASLAVVRMKKELTSYADFKPSKWTARLEKIPLISVYALWLVSKEPALKEFLVNWRYIKASITGDDLKALGIPTGPHYKKILSQLRSARLDGTVKTDKEEGELLNTLL